MVPISVIERLLRERNETDFRVLRINRSEEDELFDYHLCCPHIKKYTGSDSKGNK